MKGHMTCPYCGEMMEQGTIQNRYTIGWFPGTKIHVSCNPDFHEGAVTIAEQSIWRGAACLAYLCRRCGKVVIDLEDGATDLTGSRFMKKERKSR